MFHYGNIVKVVSLQSEFDERADSIARDLGISVGESSEGELPPLVLEVGERGVALVPHDKKLGGRLNVDFCTGGMDYRRRHGGGKSQLIAKAVGVTASNKPIVLDGTAGLGRDAFVLASIGCRVTMLERNVLVALLLQDGLLRALQTDDQELQEVLSRLQLFSGDARNYQPSQSPQVVYLDPMFPERKKTALVKKEMRYLHFFVGADEDSDEMLDQALSVANNRVVVKRPIKAPFLGSREPSYQIKGKSTRYDVYAIKKFD